MKIGKFKGKFVWYFFWTNIREVFGTFFDLWWQRHHYINGDEAVTIGPLYIEWHKARHGNVG